MDDTTYCALVGQGTWAERLLTQRSTKMCIDCKYWEVCAPDDDCILEEANNYMEGGLSVQNDGFGSIAIVVHDEPAGSKKIRELFVDNNIPSALFHSDMDVERQLRMAATLCCSYAVLTNHKLWKEGKVVVKSLATGKYEIVRFNRLLEYATRQLERFFSEIGHC